MATADTLGYRYSWRVRLWRQLTRRHWRHSLIRWSPWLQRTRPPSLSTMPCEDCWRSGWLAEFSSSSFSSSTRLAMGSGPRWASSTSRLSSPVSSPVSLNYASHQTLLCHNKSFTVFIIFGVSHRTLLCYNNSFTVFIILVVYSCCDLIQFCFMCL